ncbi:hypothetical protein CAEBREN_08012 [Caenorhabditis brenneri]|uniref:ISXO2-like transposase domain-containing protein n=1 Tax=Caenorhabditis brenneri TaxID=135651 RepID=G0NBA0_CAEBE|nr:hypothetical protein CAEBREN_08012 [Caenorhabditis brenneri]
MKKPGILLSLLLVRIASGFNTTFEDPNPGDHEHERHKRVPAKVYSIIDPDSEEPIENLLHLQNIHSSKLNDFIGTWVRTDRTPESVMKTFRFLAKDGSFFEGSHVSPEAFLYILAKWVEDPTAQVIEVAQSFNVNKQYVSEMHMTFRAITEHWFWRKVRTNPAGMKLGGPGVIVEIDESLFHKAKFSKGRMLMSPQTWVFGAVERGTNRVSLTIVFSYDVYMLQVAMFRVPDRSANTLLSLIVKTIAPGSIIVSDGWSSYGGIENLRQQYQRRWVNHKRYFVHPKDRSVHTQSIESTWGALKRKLKSRFGDRNYLLDGHLFNYVFRRAHDRKKLFQLMLVEMAHIARENNAHPENNVVELPDEATDDPDDQPIENVADQIRAAEEYEDNYEPENNNDEALGDVMDQDEISEDNSEASAADQTRASGEFEDDYESDNNNFETLEDAMDQDVDDQTRASGEFQDDYESDNNNVETLEDAMDQDVDDEFDPDGEANVADSDESRGHYLDSPSSEPPPKKKRREKFLEVIRKKNHDDKSAFIPTTTKNKLKKLSSTRKTIGSTNRKAPASTSRKTVASTSPKNPASTSRKIIASANRKTPASTSRKTIGSTNRKASASTSRKTIGSTNRKASASTSRKTIGSTNRKASASTSRKTIGSTNRKASASTSRKTIGSTNRKASASTSRKTIGSTNRKAPAHRTRSGK